LIFTMIFLRFQLRSNRLDGTLYAEIPSCQGVWAVGKTREECLDSLQKVLEEWMLFKLRDGDRDFPLLGNTNLNIEWQEEFSLGLVHDYDQKN